MILEINLASFKTDVATQENSQVDVKKQSNNNNVMILEISLPMDRKSSFDIWKRQLTGLKFHVRSFQKLS